MTITLLIATIGLSLYAFYHPPLAERMKFNAYMIHHHRQWYRLLSYGFIHADYLHLFVNMYVLYGFGRIVEYYYSQIFYGWGQYYFLLLYLGSVVVSTVADYRQHKDHIHYNAVGASGAVSAVVFAGIAISPLDKISLVLIPVPIPSFVFGLLYLVYSRYMAKKNVDNIGHNAHFWGAVTGFVFTMVLEPTLLIRFIKQIF